MYNLSPPVESPLKAWKETALKALDTPARGVPQLNPTWFDTTPPDPQGNLPIAIGGVSGVFCPAVRSGGPTELLAPANQNTFIADPNANFYVTPNKDTFFGVVGDVFGGGNSFWSGFPLAIPGMYVIVGNPDPRWMDMVFTIIYPKLSSRLGRINLSMNSPPEASNANGTLWALGGDGTITHLTDFAWATGFSAINARAGSILFPETAILKMTIQNVDFGTPPPFESLPGPGHVNGMTFSYL